MAFSRGPADLGRAPGRRAGTAGGAARRLDHRRGHRRADAGLRRPWWCRRWATCEKLREICTKHGILLIFDEVITGFGRLGENFGAQRLGVTPDIITFAKGVTNGIIPMGGIIVREEIFQAFMGAGAPAHAIELFHGYTYSGHPMAAACGHAALDVLRGGGPHRARARAGAGAGERDARHEGRDRRHRHPQHGPRRRGRPRARFPASRGCAA